MDEDPFAHAIVRPQPKTPEELAAAALGVKLGKPLAERPPMRSFRATTLEGRPAALVLVDSLALDEFERLRLGPALDEMRGLSDVHGIAGVLRILAATPSGDAFVCDLWTTGTVEDLHALAWPPRTIGDFARRVLVTLDAVHRAGVVHGALSPHNVQLDDELHPVLAEVGIHVAREGAYAAPELREGIEPDVRSDIYSAGRLLHYVAIEGELSPHPGLAPIVRRATEESPASRYETVAELVAALDAIIDELETTQSRTSLVVDVPMSPRRPQAAAAARVEKRVEKDEPLGPLPKWVPLAGVGAAVAAFGLSFVVGGSSMLGRVMLALLLLAGAAVATLVVPLQRHRPKTIRAGLMVVVALTLLVVDPLSVAYRQEAKRRMRSDDTARALAAAELMKLGRDLHGAQLAGLSLARFDLRAFDLTDADMAGADLTGANLWATKLDGAALAGARIVGADFTDSTLSAAHGFETAICDDATRFPSGLQCVAGHVASVPVP